LFYKGLECDYVSNIGNDFYEHAGENHIKAKMVFEPEWNNTPIDIDTKQYIVSIPTI